MNSELLFCAALGLLKPWYVKEVGLKQVEEAGKRELHIYIDFDRGAKFLNSRGLECGVYDSRAKEWQHLNFFEHHCYLHAQVPRVKDSQTGKVEMVEVPWARSESGFTLLFEAIAMSLIEHEMSVNSVAKILGVTAPRLWRIFHHYVDTAVARDDLSQVKAIGVDETSIKKGHNYVTVVMDMEEKRTIFVTLGKDASTLKEFASRLVKRHGVKEQIAWASIDMSPSFISGITTYFPQARIVFDKFHLMKKVTEAIDETRRKERQECDQLKGHRYTFLKNRGSLSEKKQAELERLLQLFPTLGEAYRLRETLQLIWETKDPKEAVLQLDAWCQQALDSKAHAFKSVVKTFKAHWSGIITYFENRLTNAILENTNLKIQSAKRRARGFRNTKYYINMIYFLTAKLNCNPLETL